MKINVLFLFLFLEKPQVEAQDLSSSVMDITYGYHQISWGKDLQSINKDTSTQLVLEMKDDQDRYFKLSTDLLKFGEGKITATYYVFNQKDKFYKVIIKGYDEEFSAVYDELLRQFGLPHQLLAKKFSVHHLWLDGRIEIRLIKHRHKDIFTLRILKN